MKIILSSEVFIESTCIDFARIGYGKVCSAQRVQILGRYSEALVSYTEIFRFAAMSSVAYVSVVYLSWL